MPVVGVVFMVIGTAGLFFMAGVDFANFQSRQHRGSTAAERVDQIFDSAHAEMRARARGFQVVDRRGIVYRSAPKPWWRQVWDWLNQ